MVDGTDLTSSSGLPIFYLPTPDPTSKDIEKNNSIALTYTEAALSNRVNDDGQACLGVNPGNPDCAQTILHGFAVPIDDTDVDSSILDAFRLRHPLAPWLSTEGGSHTGGKFFTIKLSKVVIVDSFTHMIGTHGAHEIPIDKYMEYVFEDMTGSTSRSRTTTGGSKNNKDGNVVGVSFAQLWFMLISGGVMGGLTVAALLFYWLSSLRNEFASYKQIAQDEYSDNESKATNKAIELV